MPDAIDLARLRKVWALSTSPHPGEADAVVRQRYAVELEMDDADVGRAVLADLEHLMEAQDAR